MMIKTTFDVKIAKSFKITAQDIVDNLAFEDEGEFLYELYRLCTKHSQRDFLRQFEDEELIEELEDRNYEVEYSK